MGKKEKDDSHVFALLSTPLSVWIHHPLSLSYLHLRPSSVRPGYHAYNDASLRMPQPLKPAINTTVFPFQDRKKKEEKDSMYALLDNWTHDSTR